MASEKDGRRCILGWLAWSDDPRTTFLLALQDRPVKSVTVVVMMGDRGLCGGYNAKMIKLAERRINELKAQGYDVGVITIGTKGTTYFKSRTTLRRTFEMGQAPSPATAAAIAEELLSEYLSGEVS